MITSIKTKTKNAFDGLINKLDMVEEKIPGLEDLSIESLKAEEQRKETKKQNKNKNRTEYSGIVRQLQEESHMHNVSTKEKMVPNLGSAACCSKPDNRRVTVGRKESQPSSGEVDSCPEITYDHSSQP